MSTVRSLLVMLVAAVWALAPARVLSAQCCGLPAAGAAEAAGVDAGCCGGCGEGASDEQTAPEPPRRDGPCEHGDCECPMQCCAGATLTAWCAAGWPVAPASEPAGPPLRAADTAEFGPPHLRALKRPPRVTVSA